MALGAQRGGVRALGAPGLAGSPSLKAWKRSHLDLLGEKETEGKDKRSYQVNEVALSKQLEQGIPWTGDVRLLIRCINDTPCCETAPVCLAR